MSAAAPAEDRAAAYNCTRCQEFARAVANPANKGYLRTLLVECQREHLEDHKAGRWTGVDDQ